MTYIRPRNLEGLKQYKYASVDRSLVSKYILKPFYTNFVIKCFPMSMAPNLITLTGFSFVVINFLTLLWYNPTLSTDCPPWVYLSWSLGLFLYQTFDAVDGTQARRTRQSGPLGELFDHGVDACNTALEVLIFAGAVNLGQSWATVLVLFGSVFTFYVQTWDEYYTQVLTLGVVSGPVEGILTLCLVYLITAIMGGGSFWHRPMLPTIGIPQLPLMPESVYNLPFTSWWIIYGAIVLLFGTLSSVINVLRVVKERQAEHNQQLRYQTNPSPSCTSNNISLYKPLVGLFPAVLAWILIWAYLRLQPTILQFHLIPFVLFVGLINAYSVGQMIVAHLVKTEFPYQNVLLVPLAFGVFDSLAPRIGLYAHSIIGSATNQAAFVFVCLGISIGVYGSFVYDVITSICEYLDIWCLTIKYPYDEAAESRKAKNP
ncbi:hypothetical protein FQN57_000862 [Myotisia sp. PD_48]|nr:hypothetical protein FQN57_000862 [Myotisia sp. PD_48]